MGESSETQRLLWRCACAQLSIKLPVSVDLCDLRAAVGRSLRRYGGPQTFRARLAPANCGPCHVGRAPRPAHQTPAAATRRIGGGTETWRLLLRCACAQLSINLRVSVDLRDLRAAVGRSHAALWRAANVSGAPCALYSPFPAAPASGCRCMHVVLSVRVAQTPREGNANPP